MVKSKHHWLVLLICVNVVLLAAIIFSYTGLPQAQAQVRAYDYVLAPGNIREDKQVLWMIDMATGRLTSCRYNRANNRIDFGNTVDLNP